jgi:hypothetical protein
MNLKPLLLTFLVSLLSLSQATDPAAITQTNSTATFLPSLIPRNGISEHQQLPAPDIDQLKQSNWYATALKNMQEGEYHFNKVTNSNSYSTPNRKNNLRFYYDENGFTVRPRTTRIPVGDYDIITPPDQIKYKTLADWKVAFNLDKKQVGKGSWQIHGSTAEYKTNNVTVQYINNTEGMRQNFIVQKPLSEEKDLKLNFSVQTTLKQRLNSDRLQFVHEQSGVVLNYEQLKVWDANGKILAAGFEKNDNDYAIHVHTAGAAYPITIDPISTTAAATLESNQANANMGFSVASAGDVNGDGYSDVIVGANLYDNGEADEGAAFIYHGSSTGISTTAAKMVESNQINAQMGISVSSAGDVNRDGYSDVIVGAYFYDNGQTDEGAAFIYHGAATGISTIATTTIESNQANARMGFSVASAGDVNGDGYSDVIVGANQYDNGETDEGAAFVHHGSAAGISTTASATVESNQACGLMGFSAASAGDVNGDGYSDVIVGAYLYDNGQTDEGGAFVYHGSAAGLSISAATVVESDQATAQMGRSVAGAGDVNGDGYGDVIVGAFVYENGQFGEGAAFVYHGSATGINITAAAMLGNNQVNANMGISVASAGDVNGDGYSDVIVGSRTYDNGESDEGAAFTYHGSATGINITAAAMLESNKEYAYLGISIASAGDVNGDGYSDIIVGAYFYENGESGEGAAFVYHGSATGVNTIAAAMLESNQASAQMGVSVAGAGDVNGDGYNDVIVGARNYDNGETNEGVAFIYHGSATGVNTTAAAMVESNQANANLGYSTASAGDVNGDGYSDVIVGAFKYHDGQTNEGAAFIYHGSATGLNTTAAAMLESNQASAQMGVSVASAGDVNGDGYSDVIVGAYHYDNGEIDEGAAFVYYGSATGINMTAAAMVESNQAGALMGGSVASAGDVNGDGYSDVIAGAQWYENGETSEGAAFIYHGSATGINTIAAAMVESNQTDAWMGYSVAGAGDVNGDGYSDIIVGAYFYDNGETDEGAAFIYHGSTTGISTLAAAMVESNQAAAGMGSSVAGAGDVNGDGYSDVIAGIPFYANGEADEGTTFVYYGNAATISNRNNLNLYNVDFATPISSSNFLLNNFGTGLFAKSFLGRDKGKMVWETKVSYEPYSGTPITNSVLYTSQQASYTDLTIMGTELKNLVDKQTGKYTKIRARVHYDPVTAITGQMYSPWRYVPSVSAGSTGGALPVDLISFKVAWHEQGKTAQVKFVTENESEICCYEIEKSDNGFNFNAIGHLDARNVQELHTYHFTDLQATGKKQYYRLKTIHHDGEIDHSRIVLLQDNTVTEILVFPNPTADVLQLQLNKAYSNIQVKIVNSAGRVVKQLVANSDANQTIKIPVVNLITGTYFLYLQTAGTTSGEEQQGLQFVKE